MPSFLSPTLGTWVAAFFTLAIFSILYKENPVYRLAEHIFVGATAAHTIVMSYNSQMKPVVTKEIMQQGNWWLIIPIIIGLMVYLKGSKEFGWLQRIPIALWMGYGAGLALTVRTVVPFTEQIMTTMKPLVVMTKGSFDITQTFNNIFFVVSVVGTLIYFFFTREHKGVLAAGAAWGRWVMMIAFGAGFGNTVMSRVSLLLGRIQFLFGPWLHIIKQ